MSTVEAILDITSLENIDGEVIAHLMEDEWDYVSIIATNFKKLMEINHDAAMTCAQYLRSFLSRDDDIFDSMEPKNVASKILFTGEDMIDLIFRYSWIEDKDQGRDFLHLALLAMFPQLMGTREAADFPTILHRVLTNINRILISCKDLKFLDPQRCHTVEHHDQVQLVYNTMASLHHLLSSFPEHQMKFEEQFLGNVYDAIIDKEHFAKWVIDTFNSVKNRLNPEAEMGVFETGLPIEIGASMMNMVLKLIEANPPDPTSLSTEWLHSSQCPLPWFDKKHNKSDEDGSSSLVFAAVHAINLGYNVLYGYNNALQQETQMHMFSFFNDGSGLLQKISQKRVKVKNIHVDLFRSVARFFDQVIVWLKTTPKTIPDTIHNLITLVYSNYFTVYQKTAPIEVEEPIVDYFLWCMEESDVTLNFRGMAFQSLSRMMGLKLIDRVETDALRDRFLPALLQFNDDLIMSEANRWLYNTKIYSNLVYSMKNVVGQEQLDEFLREDDRIAKRFLNNFFSDIIFVCEEVDQKIQESTNTNNPFLAMVDQGDVRQFSAIINIQIGTLSSMIRDTIPTFRTVAISNEVINRLSGALIHSLYVTTNGLFSGSNINSNLMRTVLELLKVMVKLKEDDAIIRALVSHVDYDFSLMAKSMEIVATAASTSPLHAKALEELPMQIAELLSKMDSVRAEIDKEDEKEIDFNKVPSKFKDLISMELITDPVVIPTSFPLILDRSSISEWLLANHTDPFTKQELTYDELNKYNNEDEKAIECVHKFRDEWDEFVKTYREGEKGD